MLPDPDYGLFATVVETGSLSAAARAIGLSPEEAHGSLRLGLGRGTTAEDVDRAASRLVETIRARDRR